MVGIECVCCGHTHTVPIDLAQAGLPAQWNYFMSVGCPSCTPEVAQTETQPSNGETPASRALKRVFSRLHESDKRLQESDKTQNDRLVMLEARCERLQGALHDALQWIAAQEAKNSA